MLEQEPLRVKVLYTLLYYYGVPDRVEARVTRGEARFSHKAVRLRPRRPRKDLPKLGHSRRMSVAVDETKLKLRGD